MRGKKDFRKINVLARKVKFFLRQDLQKAAKVFIFRNLSGT